VVDFERDRRRVSLGAIAALKAAFETAGVVFIDENGGGAGVRLSAASRRDRRQKP
jgi:hypothetical protein